MTAHLIKYLVHVVYIAFVIWSNYSISKVKQKHYDIIKFDGFKELSL